MKAHVFLMGAAVLAACASDPAPRATDSAVMPATAGFDVTYNRFRSAQGAGAMRQSAALTQAAQAHAVDMQNRGYFSHSSQDGPNGDTLVERAASAGCTMRAGAENIAQGQLSDQEVFAVWRKSPGHRANLVGPDYTVYGLGRAGDYWVMKLASGC